MSERADAPRSGGRTTARADAGRRTPAGPARETSVRGAQSSSVRRSSDARGARRWSDDTAATEGTAALKLDTVTRPDPVKATQTASSPRLRVAPPAPISAPRAPFVAVVISLVVVGVLGVLVINTKTNENSFRITRLQDQQASLNAQEQDLDNRIAEYKTPNYLNAAARRLGLVKTDNLAFIRLPDGKIIGVPKPGEGDPAVTSQVGETPAAPTTPAGLTPTVTPTQADPAQGNAVQADPAQGNAVQDGAVTPTGAVPAAGTVSNGAGQ
jgi:cell division protein FtsB